MRTLGIAIAAAAVALVCAAPADAKTFKLEDGDAGTALTVKSGDKIKVTLEQHSDGGYLWESKTVVDRDVLRLIDMRTVDPECTTPPCPIGANSTAILVYRAKGAGRTKINLVERRAFEGDSVGKGINHFKVPVTVK